MKRKRSRTHLFFSIIGLIVVAACSQSQPPERLEVDSHPDLFAHSAEFRQEVIKVTDGVYVAIGFGLANAVLLVGDDGVVIVDTMESAEAALPVKEAFNRITSKSGNCLRT